MKMEATSSFEMSVQLNFYLNNLRGAVELNTSSSLLALQLCVGILAYSMVL
jgi:hypothetical protein